MGTSLTPSEPDELLGVGEGGSATDIITHLLDLATLPTGHASESDLVTIVSAAQTAIERIMNVVSAREFLTAGRVMLTSEDTRVRFLFFVPLHEYGRRALVLDQSGSAWCRFCQNSARR